MPWLAVAYKAPAYSDDVKDKVALDLLSDVAFGPNSELRRRLVLEEQKVDDLFVDFGNHPDPELFTAFDRAAAEMQAHARTMFERWVDVAVAAAR